MVRLKTFILIIGDILILYLSLALTIIIRYGTRSLDSSWHNHLQPFSLIFLIWVLVFYLVDLYDIRAFKNEVGLAKGIGGAIILSATLSIILFYLFSNFFELTPKTNLAIFSLIFGVFDFIWRTAVIKSNYARTKLLVIGDSQITKEIVAYIKNNPQIGYELGFWLSDVSAAFKRSELERLVREKKIDAIIIPSHFIKGDLPIVKLIYELLSLKIKVMSSTDFYETIFQKEPLEELEEGWFIEKITTRRNGYDFLKRLIDIALSLTLGIIFLPIMILIAALTKLSSREGPVFFKHRRTGSNGKTYTHYKFGIMRKDEGEFWTLPEDDRHTKLGKFLRYTHLDETPQLWNILKGDLSFIGPRPERVELTEKYRELPHYEIRHIVKPGLTGWAQINYRPSASLEEAFEKLKYDIYYIKNRSFILDFLIIIRTVRYLFSNR